MTHSKRLTIIRSNDFVIGHHYPLTQAWNDGIVGNFSGRFHNDVIHDFMRPSRGHQLSIPGAYTWLGGNLDSSCLEETSLPLGFTCFSKIHVTPQKLLRKMVGIVFWIVKLLHGHFDPWGIMTSRLYHPLKDLSKDQL